MHKRTLVKKEKGQGLVEYALVLVLVAVVVIAILTVLGPQIGNVFSRITAGLDGGAVAAGNGGGQQQQQLSAGCQAANAANGVHSANWTVQANFLAGEQISLYISDPAPGVTGFIVSEYSGTTGNPAPLFHTWKTIPDVWSYTIPQDANYYFHGGVSNSTTTYTLNITCN